MTKNLVILAETDVSQLIIGAAFLLLWGAGALMSALAKNAEKKKREQVGNAVPRGQSPAAPRPTRQVPVPIPPMQREQERRRQEIMAAREKARRDFQIALQKPKHESRTPAEIARLQKRLKDARDRATMAPPPLQAPAAPQPIESPVPESRLAPTATPQRARQQTLGAETIRTWATPKNLRRQFIITELFQPPLSIRE